MDLGGLASFQATRVSEAAPTGRPRANAMVPDASTQQSAPVSTLTSGNSAMRSGEALRSAGTPSSAGALGILKSWVRGGGSPPAHDLASAVQTVRKAEAVPSSPGFVVSATAFASKLMAQTGEERELAQDLSALGDGGSMAFEGEVSVGGSLGVNLKAGEASIGGELKAATSVNIECQGSSFLVTIQTSAGSAIGGGHTGLGGAMTDTTMHSRAAMNAQVFLCDSPAAAAKAITCYHNRAPIPTTGIQHVVQDHSAELSGSQQKVTMKVKGSEKSTAVTGVFGRVFRAFDARVEKNVAIATSRMRTGDATVTKRSYEMSSQKGTDIAATVAKVVSLGMVSESRIASQVGIEVMHVTSHAGEAGAMKADLSIKIDSDKIAAMKTNFASLDILTNKETGRLVELMQVANQDAPGTFDVSPKAVDAIHDFVRTALTAVVNEGRSLAGHDAVDTRVKVGGEIESLGLEVEVGFTGQSGGIVTIKLPFEEPHGGGTLEPDFTKGEIGITKQKGFKFGAKAGVDVGVSASVEVGAANKATTYKRMMVGDLTGDVLGVDAFTHALQEKGILPSPTASTPIVLDDDDDDLPPPQVTPSATARVFSQADLDAL